MLSSIAVESVSGVFSKPNPENIPLFLWVASFSIASIQGKSFYKGYLDYKREKMDSKESPYLESYKDP